ncbi:GSCOCT00014268001.2-RA-CDS [Cotesia congregata]|uniref:Cc_bv6.1_29.2 n=2 Tax=root TaxID=1 RepID=S6D9J7_COTCN|nr:GSCOCT00014268001.2-RA-CDS [Cotesia congregata]CAG5092405.1 cc_bv6.1_29.2 [Cotesia congregata]CCB96429.1 hypothetical protein BV6-1 [Bracoviriform congregatae]CCQ71171.1 hypothetical protein BV6-1 [Cotesia congregata]
MSSSSSSSPFAPSKNSAFSPYNQYTNKSICIVPKEWKEYSKKNMDTVLQSKLTSHWSDYKKVEGAVVQIGDVAAKLEYHDNRIWMKRYGDQRSKPHPGEYVLTHVQKYGSQQK